MARFEKPLRSGAQCKRTFCDNKFGAKSLDLETLPIVMDFWIGYRYMSYALFMCHVPRVPNGHEWYMAQNNK